MQTASFTCLIVTYNSAADIVNLLTDLQACAPASRIIVVDNASKDGTVEAIQRRFPRVQLILNPANVGYARAVNRGAGLCRTEFLLLLNPDIRIASARPLAAMEECLKRSPEIAAAAPLQLKVDGNKRSLNMTWSYLVPQAFRAYLACRFKNRPAALRPIRVTFLNAGCLFLRCAAFDRVGKLNEKYFLYGEEPDLFLKFRRYGFECYLLPDVDVTHYREHSLRAVPTLARLQIRMLAVRNILDALATGWTGILIDSLRAAAPHAWKTENGQTRR